MKERLTFTECELVINDSEMPKIDIFQDKQDLYEFDGIMYDITLEIIYKRLLWIYINMVRQNHTITKY